ncbi:MAG TPA: PAS domain S-box protein [Telluria sp.]
MQNPSEQAIVRRDGDMPHQHRLELLVGGIRDYAIYMLDADGFVTSWNAGAERFKGYKLEEVLGTHFSRFYTPEDQAAGVPRLALQTALTEGKYESEGWRVRKDGTRFWASVLLDRVLDADGRLVGFAKITRDITERKRMQEELMASEQRFRILVEGVTDYAIYMLSPTGAVTNWNAGAERIKGYKAAEILGQDFSRFYTAEDRIAGTPKRALATAASEGRFEAEGWRVRKDGTRFWAHVVIDALRSDTGDLIGFAKITRDNTERRKAAESLEQARAALFQSQKMEAIGQLTGGIAHDFNNLLHVLLSGLDVLEIQAPQSEAVLDTMRRAVERGATMTQQLLAFARQQPLAPRRCDVNQLIAGFEPVMRGALTSGVKFELQLADEVWPVMVDEARLEAGLLNLVVNARDAMPDGGKLTLKTSNVTLGPNEAGTLQPARYVRICVADTGMGMSAETRRKAFEPFYSTKDVGKGTGLGLSQVHGFMVQSGGEVVLQSEEGAGTSVELYFPAAT